MTGVIGLLQGCLLTRTVTSGTVGGAVLSVQPLRQLGSLSLTQAGKLSSGLLAFMQRKVLGPQAPRMVVTRTRSAAAAQASAPCAQLA